MLARTLFPVLALLVAALCVLAPEPASAQGSVSVRDAAPDRDTAFSKPELDQILAPIALYPDDLLSNVLMASTYPLEVVEAARWIEQPANADLEGADLTRALRDQAWDPSVKSLTAFPDVLAMMSENLDWTRKLGDAVLADQPKVMDRVQFLRDKADAAGHLESNEHQTVVTKERGGSEYIYIEPAEPEIVYVPVYEPTVVYGDWWYPDYPPYYWPLGGAVYVDGYYWGVGVAIAPALWDWSAPRWHRHYIHIDPRKYNRLRQHGRKTYKSVRWRHDAHHRRGVRYDRDGRRARRDEHRDGDKKALRLKPKRDGIRRGKTKEARRWDADRRRVHARRLGERKAVDRKVKKRKSAERPRATKQRPKKRYSKGVNKRRSAVKRKAHKRRAIKRGASKRRAGSKSRKRFRASGSRRRSAQRFSGGRRGGIRRGGGRRGKSRGGRGRKR